MANEIAYYRDFSEVERGDLLYVSRNGTHTGLSGVCIALGTQEPDGNIWTKHICDRTFIQGDTSTRLQSITGLYRVYVIPTTIIDDVKRLCWMQSGIGSWQGSTIVDAMLLDIAIAAYKGEV